MLPWLVAAAFASGSYDVPAPVTPAVRYCAPAAPEPEVALGVGGSVSPTPTVATVLVSAENLEELGHDRVWPNSPVLVVTPMAHDTLGALRLLPGATVHGRAVRFGGGEAQIYLDGVRLDIP